MKKKRKQHKMLRDLRKHACSPQQMLRLKGGNCCDEDAGGLTPPPKTTAKPEVWGS